MECPCCKTQMTRAGNLPEIRGWMRYGDNYCADCSWVIGREVLDEEGADRELCPRHGSSQSVKPIGS